MAKTTVEPIKAGIDLGNGYVKQNINGRVRVHPSVAVKQFNPDTPPVSADAIGSVIEDIFNQMDLSFLSPLVKSTERRLFGERALKSGMSLEEFDVFSRVGKSEVDLSGVLALGTIAADRLQNHYEKTGSLPEDGVLKVNVDLATALPIEEHKQHMERFRDLFLNNGNAHIVTFHNFKQQIRLEITFDYAIVINEGESAQYGLMFAKEEMLDMILKEAVKRFPNGELDGITGKDLVGAPNTLGIDIGEGTIDWAVFTNRKFNSDASSTFRQGYGAVLEATLHKLQAEGYPYRSRKELSEFLHTKPSVFTKNKWEHVKNINQKEEDRFSSSISTEVSKVFDKVAGFIEVIFVFGGGATPLEWSLFGKLQARISEFGKDNMIPIVYLDSAFSRFLNVQGLYQVALRLRPNRKEASVPVAK
ncbi:ParM/StbA family protein [Paenibacillus gallinarum]|uniref:ParM/StbA family protein n=1 Tax=Paenibacillus gallinarum TaxID=2762232 RepID=A0ABR8T3E7_9BACL|nr:ParM/StbA family protein [Paenibacillus gallinarum]MBD7970285.1 ParM/StbA family protein [Paenibacillus gallinarum]